MVFQSARKCPKDPRTYIVASRQFKWNSKKPQHTPSYPKSTRVTPFSIVFKNAIIDHSIRLLTA